MKSQNGARWLVRPFAVGGVWWLSDYLRHGHPILLAVVVWLGAVMLAFVGLLIVAGLFVRAFPRLGARLFPWLAANQRRTRVAP